jgi:hypothetical protein
MNNIFPSPLSHEEECKRALAKVYALLMNLADEVENASQSQETDFKDTSEPLKQNIPPAAL